MTWYALDCETSGLDFTQDRILSFAYYTQRGKGCLFEEDKIKKWLQEHQTDNFVFHSGKFDVKFLNKMADFPVRIAWDTLVAESLLPDRPESLALEEVAGKELGVPKWKDKEMYKKGMAAASRESLKTLNLLDVEYTYKIFKVQINKLKESGVLKFFLESNLGLSSVNFLTQMEERGIGLDYEKMQTAWKENLKEHETLVERLYTKYHPIVSEYETAQAAKHPLDTARIKKPEFLQKRLEAHARKYRFNFGSPKQVLWLLRDKLNFPCKNLDGKDSTDQNVLEFYRDQHEIINALLELRANEHISGSFYKNWDKYYRSGRLHPSYHLDITKTFRLSCSEPALQQVPRGSSFREMFVPKLGYMLVVVDYSQIEPRLIAHYSGDPVLCQIFREGYDLYEYVAREILKYTGTSEDFRFKHKDIRAVAKEIALSSFYGIGPEKFAYRLRLKTGKTTTTGEAKRYLNDYFDMLKGVVEFRKYLAQRLQENPCFKTVFGRTLFFKPHEFVHLAFNKLIQCTGSDINLYSQIDLDKYFKFDKVDARCIHLVHDEALFEFKNAPEEQVTQAIEYIMAVRYKQLISVPIKVEIKIGENWGCKG